MPRKTFNTYPLSCPRQFCVLVWYWAISRIRSLVQAWRTVLVIRSSKRGFGVVFLNICFRAYSGRLLPRKVGNNRRSGQTRSVILSRKDLGNPSTQTPLEERSHSTPRRPRSNSGCSQGMLNLQPLTRSISMLGFKKYVVSGFACAVGLRHRGPYHHSHRK